MKKYISILATSVMVTMAAISCSDLGNDNGDGDSTGSGDNGSTPGGNTPGIELPASLTGSDYCILQLGEEEYELLEEKNKVLVNLFPYQVASTGTDGIALYVWDNTYAGANREGTNSYDFTSGWVSLDVTTIGWSGAGYSLTADGLADRNAEIVNMGAKIAAEPENWYFHFAYKSNQTTSHVGILAWGNGVAEDGGNKAQEYKFVFGDPAGTFTDGVTTRITPVGGTYKAGEWNEYELCLNDIPIDFSLGAESVNLFAFLSGGTQGTTLDLDAMFYYKK